MNCLKEEDGSVIVRDDLDSLLQVRAGGRVRCQGQQSKLLLACRAAAPLCAQRSLWWASSARCRIVLMSPVNTCQPALVPCRRCCPPTSATRW